MFINIFFDFILLLFINNINSEIQIKFHKYYREDSSFFFNIESFIKYYIENKYITDILIGEPSQKISGFLNPEQSAFYLTNRSCLSKNYYYGEKSNNYKLIEKKSHNYLNIYSISDSLLFESKNNSINKEIKIDNYELFVDCELEEQLCFIIGTKLVSSGEEINDNLLNKLHKNKYIKSYYFTFEIDPKYENELKYIFDIDINGNNKGYTFIKTSSYIDVNKKNLVWGLNFDKLEVNNSTGLHGSELRAEFNINLGCIIGSNNFNELFKKILRQNNIMETRIQYSNKYYIYTFNDNYYEILKNFTLDFYHKELDFHFILNYKDLFVEKSDKIYCLIIFYYKEINYWKFGLPFLKKYSFIYNQDSKFLGFLNNNKKNSNNNKVDINNSSNISNNTNNYIQVKTKVILVVFLCFIFIIIGMVFFGILIGKKLYKVRKTKTNELLELYDYNSKSDKNS